MNSPRYSSCVSLLWYAFIFFLVSYILFIIGYTPVFVLQLILLIVLLCAPQENSQNAPLVHATLETLLRFLNWIPLGYIFETKLISTLVYKVRPQRHTQHTKMQICVII